MNKIRTSCDECIFIKYSDNKQTGCTVVVPKSHKSKRFSDRKTKNFKYLEGKPGDVFIWDGNLWHGSLPNKTNPNAPSLYCAVIIKQVDEKTRSKTSINDLLRD